MNRTQCTSLDVPTQIGCDAESTAARVAFISYEKSTFERSSEVITVGRGEKSGPFSPV